MENQGVFTERGFETKQDREHYQQMDKFTQLEQQENPFEKKESAGKKKENGEYRYDDRKERKKNRKFIATLLIIFGLVWLCILIVILSAYFLFSGRHSEKTGTKITEEIASEFADEFEDIDDIDGIVEEFAEEFTDFDDDDDDEDDDDNESTTSNTISGKGNILPDQDIKIMKIEIAAGKVAIQQGDKFFLQIKKNSNNAKIKSTVVDGIWKIEEKNSHDFHFSIKDLKNITKRIKKGISVLITVPKGFEADKIKIEVDAGKVIAGQLFAKKAEFEVNAGTIAIENLTVTDEMDMEIGMGTIDIASGQIHDLNLECDMGKAVYGGILTGRNKMECNMGSIELNLENNIADYSFSTESNMGSIRIDGEKYSGLSSNGTYGDGDTQVQLTVNMGTIKVNTGKS